VKLLKVPISRFHPDKVMAFGVYISLPLNRKTIRIANAGDELTEPFLSRVKEKGFTHLEVDWNQEKGSDPESYPLYSALDQAESASAEMSEPIPKRAISTAEPVDEAVRLRQSIQPDQKDIRIAGTSAPLETESVVGGRIEDKTSETIVPGLTEGNEQKFSFSQNSGALEDSTNLGKNSEQNEVELLSIPAVSSEDPSAKEPLSIQGAALVLAADPEQQRPPSQENEELVLAGAESRAFSVERIKGGAREKEEEFRFNHNDDEDPAPMWALRKGSDTEAVRLRCKSDDDNDEESAYRISRAESSRDLPATISRLAAHLGAFLGYSSLEFLTDLSLSALVHFARNNGAKIKEEELPKLVKSALFEQSSPDSLSEDVKDILLVLDRYINDPDCDWSQRDLAKKIISRTLGSLEEEVESVSLDNLVRWKALALTSPSMETFNLCNRAAFQAMKASRQAIPEQ
jgi:hypothetical protein